MNGPSAEFEQETRARTENKVADMNTIFLKRISPLSLNKSIRQLTPMVNYAV
jgi:hypothetical protein